MTEEQIAKIISDTVNATVLKLRTAGIISDSQKTAYEKTEEMLFNYNSFRDTQQPYAQNIVRQIENSLESLKNEPYIEVIRLYYFCGYTNETCARMIDRDERTVRRNRKRIVRQLSAKLASDDFIRELLL